MQILANSSSFVGATSIAWQEHLRTAIRSTNRLLKTVGLTPNDQLNVELEDFPTFAPMPFVKRIERGNRYDPLLLQVLPTSEERVVQPGFSPDPLNEIKANRTEGVLQKYSGRVLLIATGVCAINCRYCFRRNFPYDSAPKSPSDWAPSLAEIAADPSIEEVILSGGDPLMLVDDSFRALVAQIHHLRHIRRLRIHTRLPIVIPQRVTSKLIETIEDYRKPVSVVLHCNHARELDDEVRDSCKRLRSLENVTLLNQSVLLKGVNDCLESLIDLSNRLFDFGILPYYLHQLDRVAGSHHFEVPTERGKELVRGMRAALPGYLVPRYAQEIPGENAKTILM